MKYEIETMREIWPDRGSGEYIEVGPDREGTGLVEIRQKQHDGKISDRITMFLDCAFLVAESINRCVKELQDKQKAETGQ